MPFILVNPDDTVADCIDTDEGNVNAIEITEEQLSEIGESKKGHCCFTYTAGVLTFNQSMLDAMELSDAKFKAEKQVIDEQLKADALITAASKITDVRNATTIAEVDAAIA